MSLNDPLANALSQILCEEKLGKKEVFVKHGSVLVKQVFKIMKENKYIGDYKEAKDKKGNIIHVSLSGSINKCGVVKPRFNVTSGDYKRFEKRYLPAFGFGIIIVSTAKGIMTQEEAAKGNLGGKLLAYVY